VTLWYALLSWLLLCAALVRWGRSVPPPDEVHTVPTDDGWILSVYRFRPPAGVVARPVPVVLGHGILMSRFCWELGPAVSVPRWLAARGHDVWVAEYRGTPSSQPPPAGGRWVYDARQHGWSDLPAILDGVRAATGAPRVSWVGHSMGGIVSYLYAARFGSERLHRVVTIGSPSRFGPGRGPLRSAIGPLGALLARLGRVPLQPLVFLTLPFAVFLPWTGSRLAINPRLLGFRERAGLFGGSFRDVSAGLHGWFIALKVGRRVVGDGAGDPAPGTLDRLTAPLLVIASTGDRIAPPRSVKPAWELAASRPKEYLLLGGGDGPEFGHNDLMCSREALKRVWPRVAGWLEDDDDTLRARPPEASNDPGTECPTSPPSP
jgi:polyhydroxyalkanoate synthase